MRPVLQPKIILQSRVILRNHQQVQQQLIKWEGLEDDQATWEDTSTIKLAFLDFNLEDKVSFKGDDNVTSTALGEVKKEKVGPKQEDTWQMRKEKGVA